LPIQIRQPKYLNTYDPFHTFLENFKNTDNGKVIKVTFEKIRFKSNCSSLTHCVIQL